MRTLRRSSFSSVIVLLTAILTVSTVLVALAQTRGADQRLVQNVAALEQPSPIAPHDQGPRNGDVPFFLPAVVYHSGGYDLSLAVADLNGDGKPDVVVADYDYSDSGVDVLLGNGDGTFQPPVHYRSGGGGAWSVAVGDVNGDGKLDVAVANYWSYTVAVLLGNGDGTFQAPITYPSGDSGCPMSVAIADVNGDGKPDMVVANSCYQSYLTKTISVFLGNGDGTFQSPLSYSSGGVGPSFATAADVNSDGQPDLLVANWLTSNLGTVHGTVGVLLGNNDGTFQDPKAYDSGGTIPYSIAVADVNGDGKMDLVVGNCAATGSEDCPNLGGNGGRGVVGVLLGNGDGTFQSVATYDSEGLSGSSVAMADVNGDGKPDIMVNNYGSISVGVLLGNGDGTFQTAQPYSAGGSGKSAQGLAVADVNGDGLPDLLVGTCDTWSCSSGAVGVLLHVGTIPTTTSLKSSLNPAAPGKKVTYTATVTSQDGGLVSGTVTFQDEGSTIATVTLVNNQAICTNSYQSFGVHFITAIYSGDTKNSSSIAPTLTEYIEDRTSTSLATSGSPTYVGQPLTFTATVTSKCGTIPDGELVNFYDGTTVLASVGLAGGRAACTTSSLSAMKHVIKATYVGDGTFYTSTAKVAQVVLKYPTTTSLTSSPNPSVYGQTVTFTAMVTPSGPYSVTGYVKFWDGTSSIGTSTLSGGVATLKKSRLAVGTHTITAQYLSDDYNDKSTSGVVNQVVQ